MSQENVYPVPESFAKEAHINADTYQEMYRRSIDDADNFWSEQAEKFIDWEQPWNNVSSFDFNSGEASWFTGGKLNISVNCIDRHLATRGEQTAIIWEGDDPSSSSYITYNQLSQQVNKLANILKARGVKKGDRVCIYMPMIPEATYAMLACARLGAIHSVVFGGFSPEALKDRILDSDCQTLITADEGLRGSKTILLKANTDEALEGCPNVHTCLVVKHTGGKINWQEGRDIWYGDAVADASDYCEPETMDAEDPLFILYTSGSTGMPKGVLHTTGGLPVTGSDDT